MPFFDFFSSWRVREIFLFYFSSFFFPLNHLLISLTRFELYMSGTLQRFLVSHFFDIEKYNFASRKIHQKKFHSSLEFFDFLSFHLNFLLISHTWWWSTNYYNWKDRWKSILIVFSTNCFLLFFFENYWEMIFGKSAKGQENENKIIRKFVADENYLNLHFWFLNMNTRDVINIHSCIMGHKNMFAKF